MKKFISFFLFFFITSLVYSQNDITNTLGTSGVFYVKDASTNYLTLTQSTGEVNILKGLRLEVTGNSSTTGVIFKGTRSFIHDFQPTGANGYNTFIGIYSGNFSMPTSTGFYSSFNTGVGTSTLSSLTTGYHNTALGFHSLFANTTGYYNIAFGSYSLSENITGTENTAFGFQSLNLNTTGTQNTASGSRALYSNTQGNNNTSIGYASLYLNSIGYENTALGSGTLSNNTTGYDNTASGVGSLQHNTIGLYNTAAGYHSLYSNIGGYDNTASGPFALANNTEGFYNTALGSHAGENITTGNNLMCLGFNSEPTSGTAANQITLGNNAITSLRCNVTSISSLSDARDKKNIKDLSLGIDFLMKIKPRLYNWDKREWYDDNKSDGSKMKEEPTAGFIAQELDEVQTTENAEWLNLVLKDNPEKWEATPGNLLPIIVKAIQDLKKENDELKTRLTKSEQMQNMLVAEIDKLKTNSTEITKVSLGEK